MEITSITTPIATVNYYPQDGYLHVVYLNQVFDSVEDVLVHFKLSRKLIGNIEPPLFIADIRQVKKASKEVRDLLAKHPDALALASHVAILISSPITKIMGNIFVRFSKPYYPTKLFTNVEQAKEWLFAQKK